MPPSEAPASPSDKLRSALLWFGGLFVLFVGLPGYLSCGPGIDWQWGSIHIHHRSMGNSLMAFCLVLLGLFVFRKSFREGWLEAFARYDAAPSALHRRVEASLLLA